MALNNIGLCLKDMHLYDDALTCLKQSLAIKQAIRLDQLQDCDIADSLKSIGTCLMKMDRYDEALNNLKQSLAISLQKTALVLDKRQGRDEAEALNNIALCLVQMQKHSLALTYFRQAQELNQDEFLDLRKESDIALTLYKTGIRLNDSNHYSAACVYFEFSLGIYKKLPTTDHTTIKIADIRKHLHQLSQNIKTMYMSRPYNFAGMLNRPWRSGISKTEEKILEKYIQEDYEKRWLPLLKGSKSARTDSVFHKL